MKSYPTYDALALDLDLYFFNKISVIGQIGKYLEDDSWFVITDDGYCHLFDKDGNLDDINKITVLREDFIRKDIKKIIIPDSITRIYAWAFSNCKNLISVTIPNSVKCIEDHLFSLCNSLTNITIPNSVKSIGNLAFNGCSGLTNVFFKGKTLKQIEAMKYYPWGIKNEDVITAELK